MASTDIVDMLLEHSAVLESTGALVLAAGKGRTDMVNQLIEKGEDVDEMSAIKEDRRVADDMGTALHKAVGGHWNTIQLILEKGANIHTKYIKGRETMQLAVDQDSTLITVVEDANKNQRK